jgi:hypothetical protein
MMPNITRGGRMTGLMAYLVDTDQARTDNVHTDPHLVAGDPAIMTMYGDDELDRATALAIARDLDEPHRVYGTEVTQVKTIQDPETGAVHKERVDAHVWHCSLSLRAEEGELSDEQWSAIANDFVDAMEFTETSSGRSPARWVAVRHGASKNGNDHIHIAVSLVREDGTKVNVHRDRQRSQDVARDLEVKYRLQLTTSRIAASAERGERPSERNIAERAGAAETKARRLERGVRAAAGAAETEGEFVRRLHQIGIIAKPRFAAGRDDVVAGYSVAVRPEKGEPIVWHGGGRLARDLTLQRLRDGWTDTPEAASEGVVEWQATWRNPVRYKPVNPRVEMREPTTELWQQYTADVSRLRKQLRDVPREDRATWAIVAKETSAAFAAWSERVEETPGPLADASRVLARSAQLRKHQVKPKPAGMVSASGASMLLLMATKGGKGTMAEAILFRQLVATTKALYESHTAIADARQAAQIADAMGARLDSVRARLPEIPSTSTGAPERTATPTATLDPAAEAARRVLEAQNGSAAGRPSNPLPNRIEPARPVAPSVSPERDGHER